MAGLTENSEFCFPLTSVFPLALSWETLRVSRKQTLLLYSWRFSHYSVPFHWLVHGHMTSNNETISCQMPWAGNIAKTMTSNGKQFTVTREMLTAVAGISARFSKFAFVLFCYITNHLMTGPLGNSEFCFPRISMFPSTSSRETLRFSGNKIHCSPRDQSLSVNCFPKLEPIIKCLLITFNHVYIIFYVEAVEQSGFEPWPGKLCCDLGQVSLTVPLST